MFIRTEEKYDAKAQYEYWKYIFEPIYSKEQLKEMKNNFEAVEKLQKDIESKYKI